MIFSKYVIFLFIVFMCVQSNTASVLIRRSLASTSSSNTSIGSSTVKEICDGSTPCGWAVYDRITRYINYFMKNKCECSDGKKCLRVEDDISITAYVYRCIVDN